MHATLLFNHQLSLRNLHPKTNDLSLKDYYSVYGYDRTIETQRTLFIF
jgi:hypothetical protein